MQTVECGPKDVVWLGRNMRIFVTSWLEGMSLLIVTAPRGLVPEVLPEPPRTAPANGRCTSHVFPLCSGAGFRIGGATVRLEDCRFPDLGATPLRDRLLHIDAPSGLQVSRGGSARRGADAALRARSG